MDATLAASPDKLHALNRMKWIATALFMFVTLLYVVARMFERRYPALEIIAAFAEAAMVGALADWFAVVALFRHPLGLPIPHTAIIPQNKRRLADNLGAFIAPLATGFLAQHSSFKALLAGWGFNPVHSWHWGFAAAGVGMVLGLIVFVVFGGGLREVGPVPAPKPGAWRKPVFTLTEIGRAHV